MKLPAGYMTNDMKLLNSPVKIFWIGAGCVVLGFILPLLMVLGVIESTLFLSFFTFILQIIGLILGVIATAGMALNRRMKKEQKKNSSENDHESTTGWME